MSKILIITLSILATGCAMFGPHRRSDRYMDCVKELYREGISEQRLKFLCDSIVDNNNSV